MRARSSPWDPPGRVGEAVFHLVLVVVAVVEVGAVVRLGRSDQPVATADVQPWWVLAVLVVFLVPSLFYVRTWAGEATRSRLWDRAPLVQLVGVLVAAAGAVAALLWLLGALVVLLAQHGVPPATGMSAGHVTTGMVYGQLAWDTLDSVPVLGITGTLGWDRPLPDPGWPVGVGGVLGRVAVAVWLLWTFAFLVRRLRLALLPRPDRDNGGRSPASD